ncbi:hypothetical protein DPX39_030044300 [Trypanosoma brucei equiperdum]|nr:hypothetical protein DPX39_030044300 [Trypanosoma brucei equiperdum]
MYAAINSIPVPLSSARAGVSDEYDVLNTAAISSQVISQEKLYQWVTDRCEEVIQDLRLFADIVENADSRFALTGLLVALQAVKKRMWCTEVADLESVRDLLRATVVEEEHDQGWVVLQTIANRTIPRRFLTSFTARMQSDNIESLNGKYKLLKRCWQRAAAVAREYMQLREVLRVVLAVSEVADHPNAQQRYDSVWSALCGTTAMLNAEKRRRCSESGDLDEVGAVIPMSATDDALLRQIRNLDKVTIGDIVSYFFGYVNGKVQRKTFLAALFSMKHLAGAEGYESVPFW